MLTLKIQKLVPDIKTPFYAHSGDAAFDLYAAETITLAPGERVSVPTGIAMEIPEGFVGLVWDKSGIAQNHGISTLGGVIDAGYRGEIKVLMINLSKESYTFEKNHKVAQMIIQKREECAIVEVATLEDSARGEGGFGSTGK